MQCPQCLLKVRYRKGRPKTMSYITILPEFKRLLGNVKPTRKVIRRYIPLLLHGLLFQIKYKFEVTCAFSVKGNCSSSLNTCIKAKFPFTSPQAKTIPQDLQNGCLQWSIMIMMTDEVDVQRYMIEHLEYQKKKSYTKITFSLDTLKQVFGQKH